MNIKGEDLGFSILALLQQIATLTAERDEARREVCNLMYQKGFPTGDYARERGWDLFKKDDK